MAVQSRSDLTNKPFIRHGQARMRNAQTLLTNAGRSGDLAQYTLMAQISASRKWVPFTNAAATDGSQLPRGIAFSTATEAAIKAGDVTPFSIYSGGEFSFDENQLVIENSLTLNTVITVPTNISTTVREFLREQGMYPVDVQAGDAAENS